MMKEELEKRLHELAELIYEQGFEDGKEKGISMAQQKQMKILYEQGLNDAWELAKKISAPVEDGGMSIAKLKNIFNMSPTQIISNYSISEAMQKIKEYEERQKKDEKSCGECMEFPNTFEEFAEEYGIHDKQEVYTNGSHLIPVFRVKQWLEHLNVQSNVPHCTCTDKEVAESFLEDVLAVEKQLPKQTDATDNEIKVGDEVICYGTTTRKVVLEVIETSSMSGNDSSNKHKKYRCFGETGISTESDGLCEPKITGRHFPQIAEVLEQLRGEK